MAAHLLAGYGFKELYSLEGGIKAWQGAKATGPVEFHLQFIEGRETVEEMHRLACRMEEGLKGFYERLRADADDEELAALLKRLVNAEDRHMAMLKRLGSDLGLPVAAAPSLPEESEAGVMEGGFDVGEFMRENEAHLKTVAGVLDISMMVETQALDLYLRFSHEVRDEAARKIIFEISDEEKVHLAALGDLLDKTVRRDAG